MKFLFTVCLPVSRQFDSELMPQQKVYVIRGRGWSVVEIVFKGVTVREGVGRDWRDGASGVAGRC